MLAVGSSSTGDSLGIWTTPLSLYGSLKASYFFFLEEGGLGCSLSELIGLELIEPPLEEAAAMLSVVLVWVETGFSRIRTLRSSSKSDSVSVESSLMHCKGLLFLGMKMGEEGGEETEVWEAESSLRCRFSALRLRASMAAATEGSLR